MILLVFLLLILMAVLMAVRIFAVNTSIKELHAADPALYRAALIEVAGRGHPAPSMSAAVGSSMRLWMRRKWHFRDIHKHRSVRRWMYVHDGALYAVMILFGVGAGILVLS